MLPFRVREMFRMDAIILLDSIGRAEFGKKNLLALNTDTNP